MDKATPLFQLLSSEQCQVIHDASLEILSQTGVRVYHGEALQLLKNAKATISDDSLVRIPAQLVQWALKQAPSRIALYARNKEKSAVRLEGRHVSFGPGSDCPNYLDPRTGEHRPFTTQDIIDCLHICDALPEIDFVMSMGIPSDVERHVYRRQFALMLEHTVKPSVFVCDNRSDCEAIVAMAGAASGGIESLRLNPTLLLYSEPTTPLQHSDSATGKLLYMAQEGLPVVHSPAPMMGGTAPATLAAGLALGNAEVLSGLVIHQLKRSGAPFVYGSGLHHMDMQTMVSVYGAPEFQLARAAVAQMARFYNLPSWGYAGHTDSNALDEQAATDATFSVLIALLAGNHLAHDVGYLEAGLTTSPEMIVMTAEIIQMMRRFVKGFTIDATSLALDVIAQVGPGGDFLSSDHTLEHFREFWQPSLFSRQRRDDWAADGSRRLGERVRAKTIELIAEHNPEPLPGDVLDEIAYLNKPDH